MRKQKLAKEVCCLSWKLGWHVVNRADEDSRTLESLLVLVVLSIISKYKMIDL